MKGALFFFGTFLRQLVKYPREYGTIMLYYSLLLLAAYTLEFQGKSGLGLIFVVLFLLPIFRSITQGLPVDCLCLESAIERERKTVSSFSKNN